MNNLSVMDLDVWKTEFTEEECNFDKVREYLDFIRIAIEEYSSNDYPEKHHILPRCLDMEHKYNKQTVTISCINHFKAHLKLIDCFNGIFKSKMGYVISRMSSRVKALIDPQSYESALKIANQSRTKEFLDPKVRQSMSEKASIRYKGSGNPMYGKQIPQESIRQGVIKRRETLKRKRDLGIEVTSHKGFTIYNDGVREYHMYEGDEIPKNYVKGKLPISQETRDKMKESQGNKSEETRCLISKSLKSYYKTHSPHNKGVPLSKEQKEILSIQHRRENLSAETRQKYSMGASLRNTGRVWINNGAINKFVNSESLNDFLNQGFIMGKLQSNESHIGTFFITNGEKNMLIHKDEDIPEGWRRGLTRHEN